MSKRPLKWQLRDAEDKVERGVKLLGEKIVKAERSLVARITRGTAIAMLAAALLLAALIGAVTWYTTTADFERRASAYLARVLEDATGGRVELRALHFRLWRLALDAHGLVIHGLEAPGEAPYLAADRIQLRIKVFNFLGHASGLGPTQHVSLNYLRVEHPQFHLIVDKDGRTNQPVPRRADNTPVMDTLLDLKARQVEVVGGVARFNQRAVPFAAEARDVEAGIHYIAASDRYGVDLELKDLRTRLEREPEARSRIHLEAEAGRNLIVLTRLDLETGKSSMSSRLHVTGELANFADPDWKAQAKGSLEIDQIAAFTSVDGLKAGVVDLDLSGHNCRAAAAAPRPQHLWQRLHLRRRDQPETRPAAPECVGYLITGAAKIRGAAYRDRHVRVRDVDGSARLHIMPTEILLTEMTANLSGGGAVSGDLRIADSHAAIRAMLTRVPLRAIMDITAPENYGDLGFDTAITGPATVEWGGSGRRVADTVEVGGDFTLAPTGVRRGRSNVPFAGRVTAHYTGGNDTVRIQQFAVQSPASSIHVSGVLGVVAGDRLTAMNVSLALRDLSEYDQLLTTLGLEANGRRGAAAIPVSLHGALEFHGNASGPPGNFDVKGHVQASRIEFALGSTDALIDSLVADAEYSPSRGVAVSRSMIRRGNAALEVEGWLRPRKEVSPRGAVGYVWDNDMSLDANARLAEGSLADVLQILGQREIPVTGALAANAHVTGTLQNLRGAGHVSLRDGAAYGEPYDSAVADLTVTGREIAASRAVIKLHGAEIAGSGGYDLASERLRGHVEASRLALSKFETVRKQLGQRIHADGLLSLTADADGTLHEPGLKASARLAAVSFEGHPAGEATAELRTEGRTLYVTANSNLFSARSELAAQIELAGGYQTQAKLTVGGFDINRLLAVAAPNRMVAQSSISGGATISGPLKTPKSMSGVAEFNDIRVTLQQQLELRAAEPLRLSLRDGVATLEQAHITGQDTDLRVSGAAQLFGAAGARGGKLNLKTSGSVSMTLLHSFDPDIVASGRTEFSATVGGQMGSPALSGKVRFDRVNLALDGVPNSLSDMNGTLTLHDDRLEVETLTAQTGGGDLKLGGAIRFRGGVFADLTAVGSAVRVRMYGLSAIANANLRLQGTPEAALLSGEILVTRFGVGRDVDFTAFAATGSVGAPVDPDAPANRVRLNVRVTSAPQLDFQNSYAKLSGSVDLMLRGTAASPSVLGRIQITDGSATFAGTKYQLQRGDIFFTNPVAIDPTIDLDATAQVENYEVTVGLHGTMNHLKPTYRSEPPLSETDIFALLALGRTQEEAQLYQERQLQAGTDPTSALLGGALNATVSSRMEKLFGVGSVKIDPAFVGTLGNSSARITVQEQFSRQITATFATNVNTSAQQLIQVQYDLNQNSSIVVTRDESGVFSVVYKLRKRYR